MTDFAKELLAQYYGIGGESQGCRFAGENSSDEKFESEEGNVEARGVLEDENASVTQRSEDGFDSSEGIEDSSEALGKSPRSLIETDSIENINKYSIISNGDLGPNCIRSASNNSPPFVCNQPEVNDGTVGNVKMLLEPHEYADGNDGSSTIIDDGILDNASDISSVVPSKKSARSLIVCNTPLPPTPKRGPVYNRTYVDMSSMGLTVFPGDVLEKFSAIRMLYLDNNRLEHLPEEIFTVLKRLEWLDVRNNRIIELPIVIKSHPCLESLLLQGNNIKQLPLELCTLRKLKTLQVAKNPLVSPQKEIATSGFSAIMDFLRYEWNKSHPEEPVDIDEGVVGPKLSTILCYDSLSNSKRNSKISGSRSSFETSNKSLVSQGSKSNRSKTVHSTASKEQQLLCMTILRDIFNQQSLMLQKIKDDNFRKQWRRDSRGFSRSIEKARGRNEEDIPFAIDTAEYSSIFKEAPKSNKLAKKSRNKFVPPANINGRISEVLECVSKLQIPKTDEALSPKHKQKILKKEMNKLFELQQEIEFLKKCSDLVL